MNKNKGSEFSQYRFEQVENDIIMLSKLVTQLRKDVEELKKENIKIKKEIEASEFLRSVGL